MYIYTLYVSDMHAYITESINITPISTYTYMHASLSPYVWKPYIHMPNMNEHHAIHTKPAMYVCIHAIMCVYVCCHAYM